MPDQKSESEFPSYPVMVLLGSVLAVLSILAWIVSMVGKLRVFRSASSPKTKQ
jgi:hypothetical protein